MTEIEAVEKSIAMWKWLVEHPESIKDDYLRSCTGERDITCSCYLCHYSKLKHTCLRCDLCPATGVIWIDNAVHAPCIEPGSPYSEWETCDARISELYGQYVRVAVDDEPELEELTARKRELAQEMVEGLELTLKKVKGELNETEIPENVG